VICGLSCGFAGRGSKRLFDRGAPTLTVTDPCIWHGCGTNLSRRKPVTMAGAPTDQARVCLAALPPALAMSSGCFVDQSKRPRAACDDGRSPQLGKSRAFVASLGVSLRLPTVLRCTW
jgi:hypothetical protein